MELGGVSLWGLSSKGWPGLLEPMLGGGRWNSFAWSCWADGQGSVPLTHSTGSSHTAFCPWTWSVTTYQLKLERNISCEREATSNKWGRNVSWRPFSGFVDSVSHLDAVLCPLLEVRDNRVVPKVDKPRSKLFHRDWTGQEKARTCGDTRGGRKTVKSCQYSLQK